MDLDGKVAVVTGGSRGIGLAIASQLARAGCRLALCARGAERLEQAAASLRAFGADVMTQALDVSDPHAVYELFQAVDGRLGPPDILVNNAGVGRFGPIHELTEEIFDEVVRTNLRGAFLCSRQALPRMQAKGGGYIVNLSSYAGKKGLAGTSAYSASKFGMVGLSQSLLEEGRPYGVRAVAICPGLVHTDMTAGSNVPVNQRIQPEDIAQVVMCLLKLSDVTVVQEVVIERLGS